MFRLQVGTLVAFMCVFLVQVCIIFVDLYIERMAFCEFLCERCVFVSAAPDRWGAVFGLLIVWSHGTLELTPPLTAQHNVGHKRPLHLKCRVLTLCNKTQTCE